MSFPMDVLTPIQTKRDPDEEKMFDGQFEDVLGACTIENPEEITFKTEHFDEEDTGQLMENVADPLCENADTEMKQSKFRWECNEEDFTIFDGIGAEWDTQRKTKRARTDTEFKGRDGTVWSTQTPSDRTEQEIVPLSRYTEPKGKGPARRVNIPLEAWNLLIDEPIVQDILKSTNEEIRRRRGRSSYQRVTSMIELRSWMGLSYLCGIFRNAPHKGPLDELWTLELGNAVFRVTMPLKRFEFLSECLRFGQSAPNWSTSTAAQNASYLWEKFIINCRSYYAPSNYGNINEHIICSTDTKCPYKLHLPEKPTEKGFKLLTLVDAKSLYMCNATIMTAASTTHDQIFHLVCDIKQTNRNVTTTDRHTSLPLAAKLSQSKLSLAGALPSTAKEIPKKFASSRDQSMLYGIDGTRLEVVANAQEIGAEYLLSSGVSQKINTQQLYRSTHKSCTRFHELANIYSTVHATPPALQDQWLLRFFHAVLDYAAFNAWILYRLADGENDSEGENALMEQRDFMRQLGLYLTQQHLKQRLQKSETLTAVQRIQICEILGEPAEKQTRLADKFNDTKNTAGVIPPEKVNVPAGIVLVSKTMEKRTSCRKCPSRKRIKTSIRCQQCAIPMCGKHLIGRCDTCTGITDVPESTVSPSKPNQLKNEANGSNNDDDDYDSDALLK